MWHRLMDKNFWKNTSDISIYYSAGFLMRVCLDHNPIYLWVCFLRDAVLKSWIIFSIEMVYVTAGLSGL